MGLIKNSKLYKLLNENIMNKNQHVIEVLHMITDPNNGFKSFDNTERFLKEKEINKNYKMATTLIDNLAGKMYEKEGREEFQKHENQIGDIINYLRFLQKDAYLINPGPDASLKIVGEAIARLASFVGKSRRDYPHMYNEVQPLATELSRYKTLVDNLNLAQKRSFADQIIKGVAAGTAYRLAKQYTADVRVNRIPTLDNQGTYPGDESHTYYVQNNEWWTTNIESKKSTNLSKKAKYAKNVENLNKHFGTDIKMSDKKSAANTQLSDKNSGKQGTKGSSKNGDQMLLDFIAKVESGGYYYAVNNGESGNLGLRHTDWKRYWENNHGRLPMEMTIDDIKQLQAYDKGPYKDNTQQIFAVGKYQIIPKTLFAVLEMEPISDDTLFDAATQEKLGRALIYKKRPKLGKYLSGEHNNINQAMLELAKEFASFPVPYNVKNSKKGETYYTGEGNNKAHYDVAKVKEMLKKARKANGVQEAPPQKYVYIGDSQAGTTGGLRIAIAKNLGKLSKGKNLFQIDGGRPSDLRSTYGEDIKKAVSNTENIIFTLGGNGPDMASYLALDVLQNAPETANITWILAPPAVEPTFSTKFVNTGEPDREVNTYKATRAKFNKEITKGIEAVDKQKRINIIDPYPWFEENVESSKDGVHVDKEAGEKFISSILSTIKPSSTATAMNENLAISEKNLRKFLIEQLTSKAAQEKKRKENEIEYSARTQSILGAYSEIKTSELFGVKVYHKSGVKIKDMDEKTKQMLAALTIRAKLDGVTPPVITDGPRTSEDQASRMWSHWWNYETKKGKLNPIQTNGRGRRHLVKLYHKDDYANGIADMIERLFYAKPAVPSLNKDGSIKTKEQISKETLAALANRNLKNIKAQVIKRGGVYLDKNKISDHQIASAFDIRTRDNLQSDVEKIIFHDDFKGLISVNDETKSKAGPHYHITVKKAPKQYYLNMLKKSTGTITKK